MDSVCGCARPRCRGSCDEWQGSNLLECSGERDRPRPSLGEAQHDGSTAVDEATREGEYAGAHAASHSELIARMDIAQAGAPADEVVGEDGAGEPGRVGEEVARGAVFQPRPLLEVADGELDAGMGAVESIGFDGVEGDVGDESVVTPLGPQGRLARIGQA